MKPQKNTKSKTAQSKTHKRSPKKRGKPPQSLRFQGIFWGALILFVSQLLVYLASEVDEALSLLVGIGAPILLSLISLSLTILRKDHAFIISVICIGLAIPQSFYINNSIRLFLNGWNEIDTVADAPQHGSSTAFRFADSGQPIEAFRGRNQSSAKIAYNVVPIVPKGWNNKQQIPLWVGWNTKEQETPPLLGEDSMVAIVQNSQGKKHKNQYHKAILDAENRFHVRSHPGAPVVQWKTKEQITTGHKVSLATSSFAYCIWLFFFPIELMASRKKKKTSKA